MSRQHGAETIRHRRASNWLLTLLLLSLISCSARRRVDGDMVRHIKYQGNHHGFHSGQNDDVLRRHMNQKQSSFGALLFPLSLLVKPEAYNPHLLANDVRPLEVFLASNGWLDAQVMAFTVVEVRPERKQRARVVDIIGHLDIGATTVYDEQSPVIDWPDRHPNAPPVSQLEHESLVHPGRRVEVEALHYAAHLMEKHLHREGFAYATVEPELVAWPEQRLGRATFHVRSGIPTTFGPVAITGIDHHVEIAIVEDMFDFELGDPYNEDLLHSLQLDLFELGAFSVVTVSPDRSDPSRPDVPIHIELLETAPRSASLGGGLDWEGLLLTPHLYGGIGHDDIASRLIQAHATATFGVSANLSDGDVTPVYGLDLDNRVPRALGPQYDFDASSEFHRDLVEGQLARYRAGFRWSILRHFGKHLSLSTGPGIEWMKLDEPTTANEQALEDVVLGVDFDAILQTPVTTAFTIDFRRGDELDTRHGTLLTTTWRRSLPLLGPTNYDDLIVEGRGWFTPKHPESGTDRLYTFGVRAQGRTQRALGDSSIPWPDRVFLGGSTNLRGFRAGQVGAYDCVCVLRNPSDPAVTDERDISRRYLPRGGAHSLLSAAELRIHQVVLPEVSIAMFAEAGTLATTFDNLVDPSRLRLDVGAGGRYATPIGPIRVDFSIRPIYPEDEGPTFGSPDAFHGEYLACDGVGPRRRPFDLVSEFGRTKPLDRTIPAVNFFLGIGEAF